MMIRLVLCWVMVASVGCSNGVAKIGVEQAAASIDKDPRVQVVDVRRPDEFASGHLQGAVLVTWGKDDFEKQAVKMIRKDQPVLVYCRSGRRSTAAAAALEKLGYTSILNLDGGITAWQAAGKPVTTPE